MTLAFLQHSIHDKLEAYVVILCLISVYFLGFLLKHYRKEIFEIILLLPFHSETHFYMV